MIIPKDNLRDLEEIDQTVRKQLNFVTAETVDTVLSVALNPKTEMDPSIRIPEDVKTPACGLRQ